MNFKDKCCNFFNKYIIGFFSIIFCCKFKQCYMFLRHKYLKKKYPYKVLDGRTRVVDVYLDNRVIHIPFRVKMLPPNVKYYGIKDDDIKIDITDKVSKYNRCIISPVRPEWFNSKRIETVNELHIDIKELPREIEMVNINMKHIEEEKTRVEGENTRVEEKKILVEGENMKPIEEEKTRVEGEKTRVEGENTRVEEKKILVEGENMKPIEGEKTRVEEEKKLR